MGAVRILLALASMLSSEAANAAAIDFHAAAGDRSTTQIRTLAHLGGARVEQFFGGRFLRSVDFRLVSDRAAFDAAIPPELGMGKSQCWMVGMGIGDRLVLLDPDDWKAEACEHDPGDTIELQRLIAHELTHVYRGQHNPHPDFAGEDDLGWWVEGLAVLVSGQLTPDRVSQVRAAIAAGTAPTKLDEVWSGKLCYGFAGSLAAYVDKNWGRAATRRLLAATSNAEALRMLGVTQAQLLAGWKKAAG